MPADGRLRFVAGDRAAALAALDAGGATIVPVGLADRLGLTVGRTCRGPDRRWRPPRPDGRGHRRAIDPGPDRRGDARRLDRRDERISASPGPTSSPSGSRPMPRRRPTTACGPRPSSSPSRSSRSTGSRARSATRSVGSSGCSMRWPRSRSSIAALGIVNTLTMNVIERVREIGILRAAGMTRRQVWRSVVVEAGVLGLAGALLGIVLGLVVGALMVVLAGGRLDRRERRPVAGRRPRPRPRRRAGDAGGGLSGPPREPPVRSCGPSSTSDAMLDSDRRSPPA